MPQWQHHKWESSVPLSNCLSLRPTQAMDFKEPDPLIKCEDICLKYGVPVDSVAFEMYTMIIIFESLRLYFSAAIFKKNGDKGSSL